MDKETSSRVSTIAASMMGWLKDITPEEFERIIPAPEFKTEKFLNDVRTLAGSCMSQDETPGQEPMPDTFLNRLKKEQAQLSGRLDALSIFLHNGSPGTTPRHRNMLDRQRNIMSDLLAVLDERLADLAIDARSTTTEKIDG